MIVNKSSNFVWGRGPIRSLCLSEFYKAGRNNFGRIVVRHRCSRYFSKKIIRLVNFKIFNLKNDFAQIIRFEKDPNRTSFIALVRLLRSGFLCYIPALSSMRVGSFVSINPQFFKSDLFKKLRIYSALCRLTIIPKGFTVSNIGTTSGSTVCRSAGAKAKLQSHYPKSGLVSLLLSSGKTVLIPLNSYAYTGEVSNQYNYLKKFYKAGQSRYFGLRPEVRGVAMNPVDHPHGGGEGKTSGGRPSVSPWGVLTKGYKTVSSKKVKIRIKVKRKHILLSTKF